MQYKNSIQIIPITQEIKHQINNHRDPKLDNAQGMGDFGTFSPTWGYQTHPPGRHIKGVAGRC